MSDGIQGALRNIGGGALNGAIQGLSSMFAPGGLNTIKSGATIMDNSNGRVALAANAADQEETGKAQMDHDKRVGTMQRAVSAVQSIEKQATQAQLTSQANDKEFQTARGRVASAPFA